MKIIIHFLESRIFIQNEYSFLKSHPTPEEHRHGRVYPGWGRHGSFEVKPRSGNKGQGSSLHFGDALTTVTATDSKKESEKLETTSNAALWI